MIYYPFIRLPEYFTHLLKTPMNSEGDSFNSLKEYIWDNDSLQAISKKIFLDISADFHLEVVIKALGWNGMRNRYASAFIEYSLNGSFPANVDTSHIDSALNLEEKTNRLSVSGHSRAFLFAFYLKMALIDQCKKDPSKQYPGLFLKEKHIELLSYAKSRVIPIDWLLFLIIHLESYLGESKLREILSDEDLMLDDIFLMISKEQKENLVENFLNYGASISDQSLFVEKRV